MSGHATVRVGWLRWHFPRTTATLHAIWTAPRRLTHAIGDQVAIIAWDLHAWVDDRAERRDTNVVWGADDGTTGVVHPDPEDFADAVPDQIITFDGELTEDEYEWLKARWLEKYGRPLEPLPEFPDVIDYEAVPGSQTRDYWRMQLLGRPTMPVSRTPTPAVETGNLPGPTVHALNGEQVRRAGEPDLPAGERGGASDPGFTDPATTRPAVSLPVPGAGDGRTHPASPGGDRAPAADETSIDVDGWLIELLCCSPERIDAAARYSMERYEQQTRRQLAAYLTELAEVAA